MKKLALWLIGTLLYVAPLLGLYLQTRGTKALCEELQGIRRSIEKLYNQKETNYVERRESFCDDLYDFHVVDLTDMWDSCLGDCNEH